MVLAGNNKTMTQKNNHNLQLLSIISVIAIIAIVVLVFSKGGFQGAVAFNTTTEYQSYCSDNDVADDFYVAGTVHLGNKLYPDLCYGDVLIQNYCFARNVKSRRPYKCPKGCVDGACIAG